MTTLIRSIKERRPGVPYEKWRNQETYATHEQEETFDRLRMKWPMFEVVVHRFLNEELADVALVALSEKHSVIISSDGTVEDRRPLYPFCLGNPTTAHCIAAGYCTRRPYACNE